MLFSKPVLRFVLLPLPRETRTRPAEKRSRRRATVNPIGKFSRGRARNLSSTDDNQPLFFPGIQRRRDGEESGETDKGEEIVRFDLPLPFQSHQRYACACA